MSGTTGFMGFDQRKIAAKKLGVPIQAKLKNSIYKVNSEEAFYTP